MAILPVSVPLELPLEAVGVPVPRLLPNDSFEGLEGFWAPDTEQGAETVTGMLTVSVLPERVIVESKLLLDLHPVLMGAVYVNVRTVEYNVGVAETRHVDCEHLTVTVVVMVLILLEVVVPLVGLLDELVAVGVAPDEYSLTSEIPELGMTDSLTFEEAALPVVSGLLLLLLFLDDSVVDSEGVFGVPEPVPEAALFPFIVLLPVKPFNEGLVGPISDELIPVLLGTGDLEPLDEPLSVAEAGAVSVTAPVFVPIEIPVAVHGIVTGTLIT